MNSQTPIRKSNSNSRASKTKEQSKKACCAENSTADSSFCLLGKSFSSYPWSKTRFMSRWLRTIPSLKKTFFLARRLQASPYIKIRNPGYSEYDTVFDRHEVVPRTRFVMDNDFAVMGMVNKGLGYSLFPKLILRKAPFQLARIELEIPTHRELGIAMRSWDRASMAAKAFVETVRTWVAAWDERVEFDERWDNLG